jgi:hypothetical protein
LAYPIEGELYRAARPSGRGRRLMEYVFRILAGLILLIFVVGPICVALGALVVHLWRRVRGSGKDKDNGMAPPGTHR